MAKSCPAIVIIAIVTIKSQQEANEKLSNRVMEEGLVKRFYKNMKNILKG